MRPPIEDFAFTLCHREQASGERGVWLGTIQISMRPRCYKPERGSRIGETPEDSTTAVINRRTSRFPKGGGGIREGQQDHHIEVALDLLLHACTLISTERGCRPHAAPADHVTPDSLRNFQG